MRLLFCRLRCMKKEHVEVLKRRTLKLLVTEGVYASLHVTWCRQII